MRALVVLLFCVFCIDSASAALLTSSKYDAHFHKWSGMYMPAVDWRLLKAQCWTESHFKEDAVSPVGAAGLCQFMPATWSDTKRQLGFSAAANIFDPALSIQAAAYYMGRMRAIWTAPRPEYDRHSFALASYNGGAGNIIKAQKLASNSPLWPPVAEALPQVTGKHAAETRNYVTRIWAAFRTLVLT